MNYYLHVCMLLISCSLHVRNLRTLNASYTTATVKTNYPHNVQYELVRVCLFCFCLLEIYQQFPHLPKYTVILFKRKKDNYY